MKKISLKHPVENQISKFFILVILLINGSHALYEELTDLLGNSLTYLKQGLDIVRQVDDFVEHTIGEECLFECPKPGFIPVPRKFHQASANGCGSFDFLFDDSEESFLYVEKEFSQCCNLHDHCYDTCGADKDECDLRFKKCLYGSCKNRKERQFLDSKKCRLKAKMFYITVLGIGCQSFISAQNEACECILDKSEL